MVGELCRTTGSGTEVTVIAEPVEATGLTEPSIAAEPTEATGQAELPE